MLRIRNAVSLVLASAVSVFAYSACGGATIGDAFTGTGAADAASSDAASDRSSIDVSSGGREGGASGSYVTTCANPGECTLGAPGCCGIGCGEPNISSFVAIHRGQESALRDATCDDPNTGCPDCATRTNPNFAAFCREQKCVVVDIRTNELSACERDDDCKLRPASCCPCEKIDVSELVAIRKDMEQTYLSQICDPSASCPSCNWRYDGASPRCSNKHCVVSN